MCCVGHMIVSKNVIRSHFCFCVEETFLWQNSGDYNPLCHALFFVASAAVCLRFPFIFLQ